MSCPHSLKSCEGKDHENVGVLYENESKLEIKVSEITAFLKIVEALARHDNPKKEYMNDWCSEVHMKH